MPGAWVAESGLGTAAIVPGWMLGAARFASAYEDSRAALDSFIPAAAHTGMRHAHDGTN
jgi:hypothetical protein